MFTIAPHSNYYTDDETELTLTFESSISFLGLKAGG